MSAKRFGSSTTSYAEGDTVKVKAGLMKDRQGTIEKIDRNGRLSVRFRSLVVLYRPGEVESA